MIAARDEILALLRNVKTREELLQIRAFIDAEIRAMPAPKFPNEVQARNQALMDYELIIEELRTRAKALRPGEFVAQDVVNTYVSAFNLHFPGDSKKSQGIIRTEDVINVRSKDGIVHGLKLTLYKTSDGFVLYADYASTFRK